MTAKGPDNEWLTEIIDEHQTSLLRLCYLYLHDVHLAEDAVQETFLKAWRMRQGFRSESSVKTWLTRIAIRTCCDVRRTFWFKRLDRRFTPDMLPASAWNVPDTERELTLAVMKLPPKLQDVIVLHYYQELKVNDIAAMLHISQSSVSGRLTRTRTQLKRILEKEESP